MVNFVRKIESSGVRVVYQIVGFTPILVNSSRSYNMSVFEFKKKNRVKCLVKRRLLKEITNKYKHIKGMLRITHQE
ncbi:hypothetical protein HanXRQr2_Chr05g0221561 [Helianthus annuus]|uniref:Uncharacterized protein n=1 Tax=Helianthus annuus TaxID=4232 RepID=A0A251UQW5_HELAN|nr:hypothetical protein HanXRQr2_Chr05g0221561 [Helianthus annuus]KAJ0923278.1 hypothetical protein HanPSC8_Chr05g0214021 [Helianthus annuus]